MTESGLSSVGGKITSPLGSVDFLDDMEVTLKSQFNNSATVNSAGNNHLFLLFVTFVLEEIFETNKNANRFALC